MSWHAHRGPGRRRWRRRGLARLVRWCGGLLGLVAHAGAAVRWVMPGALAGAPSRKNTIAQRRLHVHALTAPRMTACNSLPGGKARRQITQRNLGLVGLRRANGGALRVRVTAPRGRGGAAPGTGTPAAR